MAAFQLPAWVMSLSEKEIRDVAWWATIDPPFYKDVVDPTITDDFKMLLVIVARWRYWLAHN